MQRYQVTFLQVTCLPYRTYSNLRTAILPHRMFTTLTGPNIMANIQCVCVCGCSLTQSCLTLCSPCTAACHAPLFMGFSRQEYWSGLPFPTPGDLADPGMEPMSLASSALAGGFFTSTSTTWEALLLSSKVCMLSRFSHVQLCGTLWTVTARRLCLWDSPGKNVRVGCHALCQGILLTQG